MIRCEKKDKDFIIKSFLDNKIIIMLTDTVYGIMAIANKENEKKINMLKRSDINKKLSVIFPNKDYLFKYIKNLEIDKKKIIDDKLPGKYTFIVELDSFSDFERNDFGVRVTGNKYLQDIIEIVGPILATSCNISGCDVCNSVIDIVNAFANEDVILVEDEDAYNKATTIIDLRDDIKIIRN